VLNGPRIEKVPITAMEAFRSPLMGLFEKRRAAKFFRSADSPRGALRARAGRPPSRSYACRAREPAARGRVALSSASHGGQCSQHISNTCGRLAANFAATSF
jgi:hypothetical protein